MNVIEIQNVTKVYKALDFWKKERVTAVDSVNLSIKKGEVFGLLGLNGAGKTTLMKVLLGLLKPTGGKVKIFGKSIDDRIVRGRIGYLSELPYFPKYLTAYEIMEYFAEILDVPRKNRKEHIKNVLETAGLGKKMHVKVKGFSKGMQGRLGLAQAILNDPELLFLDEPMSGLDPMGYKDTRDIILKLNREGKTVFFNSHILSEVEKICDRIGIINNGRLVEVENVKAIKRKYKNLEEYFLKILKQKKAGRTQNSGKKHNNKTKRKQ